MLEGMDDLSVTALDPQDSTFVDRLDKYNTRSVMVNGGSIHDIYDDYQEEEDAHRSVNQPYYSDHKFIMDLERLTDGSLVMDFEQQPLKRVVRPTSNQPPSPPTPKNPPASKK